MAQACDGCGVCVEEEELTLVCESCNGGWYVCEDCEVDEAYGLCPCGSMRAGGGDDPPGLGDSDLAALFAKLDQIEQATDKLNEQNSEMMLERTFLREGNEAMVRECSTLAGGSELVTDDGETRHRRVLGALAEHLSPAEAQVVASTISASAHSENADLRTLSGAEKELQEQALEIAALLHENEQLKREFANTQAAPAACRPPSSAPVDLQATFNARANTLEDEIAQLEQQMARVRTAKKSA